MASLEAPEFAQGMPLYDGTTITVEIIAPANYIGTAYFIKDSNGVEVYGVGTPDPINGVIYLSADRYITDNNLTINAYDYATDTHGPTTSFTITAHPESPQGVTGNYDGTTLTLTIPKPDPNYEMDSYIIKTKNDTEIYNAMPTENGNMGVYNIELNVGYIAGDFVKLYGVKLGVTTDYASVSIPETNRDPTNPVGSYDGTTLTLTIDKPSWTIDQYIITDSNGAYLTFGITNWTDDAQTGKRTIQYDLYTTEANLNIVADISGNLTNLVPFTIVPHSAINIVSAYSVGSKVYVIFDDPTYSVYVGYRLVYGQSNTTSDATSSNFITGRQIAIFNTGNYTIQDGETIQLKACLNVLSQAYTPPASTTITNSSPGFNGLIQPIRDNLGKYYLVINNLTLLGSSFPSPSSIQVLNSGGTVVQTISYTGSGTYRVNSQLTYNTNCFLRYNGAVLPFSTAEYFRPTVSTTNVADNTASVVVTIPQDKILITSNKDTSDYDLTNLLTGIKIRLYNNNSFVSEQVYSINTDTYTFDLTGLSSGTTYTTYKVGLTASTTMLGTTFSFETRDKEGVSFTTTGSGGGGGGGGGGNNGGTGHNNMSTATLEFSYDGYTGTVGQTNTITILGEEGGALSGTEIVVNVPLDKFRKVLQYGNNWTTSGDAQGEQLLPKVLFRPLEATAELDTMFDKLKVKGTGAAGTSGRLFADDAGTDVPVFGNVLLGITFTDSALDSEELPREAIRKIDEGEITADSLTADVLENLSTVGDPAPAYKALLEGLFEQAVSAGRVKDSDDTTNAQTGAQAGYACPSFAVDDKISFLVTYTFNKERDYILDGDNGAGDVTAGNTITGARRTFTVAGETFDIDGENEKASTSVTYIITLRAVAAA